MATVMHNWEKPDCLVDSSDENGLHVNEETVNLLTKVNVPVDVVAIVGPYRTGKSYLLNRLAGRNTGFDIGSTIQAKTKGIWAWCRPHPKQQNTCLLLLDTEGLGDPEKGDKDHDVWIFTLTLLLCNTFIYNSKGTIDQDALDKLHFVTEISENVKIKAGSEDEKEYEQYFPSFIWAVRDFHLKLEIDGKPCSADDYMENALKLRSGVSNKVIEYNRQRRSIKEYFSSRKCFVFPPPLHDMDMLEQLESSSHIELREGFLETTESFLKHLKNTSRPKSIIGAPVTGSALVNLCETYVKAIQDGAVPCIESAVDAMARAENTKALEEAFQLYKSAMQKISLPTNTMDLLSAHHQKCEKKAIALFMSMSIFDREQIYQKELQKRILAEYESICKENGNKSWAKSSEIIKQLYQPISDNVQSGHYLKHGGYIIYHEDMHNLLLKYKNTSGKGIKAAEVLAKFMKEKDLEYEMILNADKKISADQKKIKDKEHRAEQARLGAEAARVEMEKLAQVIADRDSSHHKNLKQLSDKFETQIKNLEQKLKEESDNTLQNQAELMKKGFKEEAEGLWQKLKGLKSRKEEMAEKLQEMKTEIKMSKERRRDGLRTEEERGEGGEGIFSFIGGLLDSLIDRLIVSPITYAIQRMN